MPKKNWYSIQSKAVGEEKEVEIRIYDEIGFWGVTAKSFTDQLDALSEGAARIVVSLNSPGGNVFDAFAIYNALVRHHLPVTTRVDGVAASAASLIFMAGDERVMPENAMLMVHEAWTIALGTATELRKTAEMMDKTQNGIVSAYARSGKSEEEIIEMMQETTWMDAFEAQAMGFATAMEAPVKIAASASVAELLAQLPGAPAQLLAQVDGESDDVKAKPDSDPAPDPEPAPAPSPEPGNSINLASHVYAECRAQQIPHLAESVIVSSGNLHDKAAIDARLAQAKQIAGLCMTAKLQDKAADFITAGLDVEQVRARLFDIVVSAADSIHISNIQPPQPSATTQSGPNPMAIYASRKAFSEHRSNQ